MKTILFDIDGTLLLSGRAGHYAIQDAMLELFGIEKLERIRVHGQTDRGIAQQLFAAHGLDCSEENWLRFRDLYLKNLELELPRREGAVLPGALPLLQQLKSRGDSLLGLLTGNTAIGANLKLTHYQLAQFFAFGGFGDDFANRNDVAAMAKAKAEEHLGEVIDANQVWVIGDTENDILCAQSIGARIVAVATGDTTLEQLLSYEPDLAVESLEDPRIAELLFA